MSSSFLEMPQLGAVPRSFTLHGTSTLAAHTALALLDAGHLNDKGSAKSAPDLVETGLLSWLAGNMRGLEFYDFTVHYLESRSAENAGISVCLTAGGDIHALQLGRRFSQLPRELAETALYWINQAGAATLPIYMPSNAEEFASWNYWGGALDERDVLQQMIDEEEDPKDYTGLTRKQFDAHIPTWCANPKKRVSIDTIKRASSSRSNEPAIKTARAIYTLIGALAEYRKRIDLGITLGITNEAMFWPPPVGLFIRGSQGVMARIYDDFAEDIYNSGEHREEWAGVAIEPGRNFSKELQQFMRGVEPVFPILRTLETLLKLITGR